MNYVKLRLSIDCYSENFVLACTSLTIYIYIYICKQKLYLFMENVCDDGIQLNSRASLLQGELLQISVENTLFCDQLGMQYHKKFTSWKWIDLR